MMTPLLTSFALLLTGLSGDHDTRLWYDCICTKECPSDINADNAVDVGDLLLLTNAWGTDNEAADVDDNGTVDIEDLLNLLAAFGSNCLQQPETLPCPATPPPLPVPMATPYCGDITDRFVGCKTGIKYLDSPIRTQVMQYDSQDIQDNSAAALMAINNTNAMASAVWATIDASTSADCAQSQSICFSYGDIGNSTPTNLLGHEMEIPKFGNGVDGNAIRLWSMQDGATVIKLVADYRGDSGPPAGPYQYDFSFFKLMDWVASVDFQFASGWDDKLIKAVAILEKQLKTCPPGINPPQPESAKMLYRGAPILCQDFKLLQDALSEGTPLYVRGFWATSTDPDEANNFILNGPWTVKEVTWVKYEINYQGVENIGYDIKPFSAFPGENEVLFPPYVEFTVTDISDAPNLGGGAQLVKVTVK